MPFVLANILIALAVIVVGYLFGAIPNGVIIGKAFFHKDPRDFYSHNSGGTNTGRVLGKKIGVLVIILDMIKTLIPVFATWAILSFTPLHDYMIWNSYDATALMYWGAGLAAAIGHCWPIYIRFKGGKCVACFMGLNVLTSWIEFVICGVLSYIVVLNLKKLVSLSSIISSIVGTLVAWVFGLAFVFNWWNTSIFMWDFGLMGGNFLRFGLEFAIVDTIMATILILRHSANIQRIKSGTEHRIDEKLESK